MTLFYAALVVFLVFIYAWSFYNLPIVIAGIKNLKKGKKTGSGKSEGTANLPSISIVVPVKNEEKVIGRLLTALGKLNYPRDKWEALVVEDGSLDRTLEICTLFTRKANFTLRILQKPVSDGKPSALNYGIAHAKGELIGVFDADSVPDRNVLFKAARYFEDPATVAVQGRTLSINSDDNMLTKFLSKEEAVWFEAYLRGKDVLKLFVHLKGSCQFIRRNILNQMQGFDEGALSEDMELSARLTQCRHKIRYAPDVRSWEESPGDIKQLLQQRTRWYRGTMEIALKYGRLMTRPSLLSFDAEATLFGPFVLILSFLAYLWTLCGFFKPVELGAFWAFLIQTSAVGMTCLLVLAGFALLYSSNPKKTRDLLWLPFIYCYWLFQTFIALYAMMLIVLRRPRRWLRTEKKGSVASATFQNL